MVRRGSQKMKANISSPQTQTLKKLLTSCRTGIVLPDIIPRFFCHRGGGFSRNRMFLFFCSMNTLRYVTFCLQEAGDRLYWGFARPRKYKVPLPFLEHRFCSLWTKTFYQERFVHALASPAISFLVSWEGLLLFDKPLPASLILFLPLSSNKPFFFCDDYTRYYCVECPKNRFSGWRVHSFFIYFAVNLTGWWDFFFAVN